jgi:hypothetical protein
MMSGYYQCYIPHSRANLTARMSYGVEPGGSGKPVFPRSPGAVLTLG